MILKDIWLDVKAVQERDPAARSALEVLLLYQAQNRPLVLSETDVFYCPPDFPDCQIFYSD